MFHVKLSLFSQTKSLESKIDLFHDKIIDAAMTFKKAIRIYLAEQRSDEYKKLNKQIKQIEHDADVTRRDIESRLYEQNLIPDLRADVLNLVEISIRLSINLTKSATAFILSALIFLPNTTSACLNFAIR